MYKGKSYVRKLKVMALSLACKNTAIEKNLVLNINLIKIQSL